MTEPSPLKRSLSLSLSLLTFYGLGTILGAGIYVLVGKVEGYAGPYVPMAFHALPAFVSTRCGFPGQGFSRHFHLCSISW